ncbi:hypothetical protein ACSMXN_16320 [Jatrophihabitans sp. DSM 45814]
MDDQSSGPEPDAATAGSSGGTAQSASVGSLGDEAAKLIAAAQDWFHTNLGDSAAKIATGAPECARCPLCQLISVIRGDRPELGERVTEVQGAFAGLLHALGDALSTAGATSEPTDQKAEDSARPRVQKINLDSAAEER